MSIYTGIDLRHLCWFNFWHTLNWASKLVCWKSVRYDPPPPFPILPMSKMKRRERLTDPRVFIAFSTPLACNKPTAREINGEGIAAGGVKGDTDQTQRSQDLQRQHLGMLCLQPTKHYHCHCLDRRIPWWGRTWRRGRGHGISETSPAASMVTGGCQV